MMKLFDLHCDTLYKALKEDKTLFEPSFHISIDKGLKYFPWIQCFAVWIPDEIREAKALNLFCRAKEKLDATIKENKDKLFLCKEKSDFDKAEKENSCGVILTVEGGSVLGGNIDNLDYLHNCGVKMITLTWNGDCEIGSGVGVENCRGITPFGKEVIKKMEDFKIAIDISHASDKLFYDVIETASGPIVASHSNSRKICSHRRNLTDDQFKIMKDKSGLVGLNFSKGFLNGSKEATMYDIIRHADHFLSLGGEKVLCMGSDFDGTDIPNDLRGIEDMESLYELFLKEGYKQGLVDDIFFNNAFNFFKDRV
ncbi:MAG: hypothetical protein RUMPE_00409 [Eubacteriales bacterium SKADARSKE-1]|nr:hypothetical protein [Eubacteriales bacterium SKADARSKE-1]